MLDIIDRQTTETKLDTAAKRALIEAELRANPQRSDREIGRIIGADHKTVGSVRAELGKIGGENSPPREELFRVAAPHIDFDGPAFKESVEKIDELTNVEAARTALGMDGERGDDEQTLLGPRREITIRFAERAGRWILSQKHWPDEDSEIWINEEDAEAFLEALCDRLGVVSFGRSK